ncbi:hypothetical protein JDV02_004187 [Purpureocillium takamizusanense]|uniref:Uncharacterized protein n=1 Tax=Purpureocillium takamizusanense TaxID=2060973 RepID=A0A9Q8QC00_9HYPO|nr:uncharacterized protein JDV02_004187 [Purpureocillium takamizusanense]UNI17874.1 hypothetical protein JDV02_004187 [Purpureocillium takamizusanense]
MPMCGEADAIPGGCHAIAQCMAPPMPSTAVTPVTSVTAGAAPLFVQPSSQSRAARALSGYRAGLERQDVRGVATRHPLASVAAITDVDWTVRGARSCCTTRKIEMGGSAIVVNLFGSGRQAGRPEFSPSTPSGAHRH